MINPTLARDFDRAAACRAVGTSDDVTTCELCGKEGLASTIIIEFLDENGSGDGEAYLGSDCAARKLAGRADRRLAAKITREAKAADLKRTAAVDNSRRFLDYYGPFVARQENPAAKGDRGAFIREYTERNPLGRDRLDDEIAPRAVAALARHREVIATGGRSAL